MEKIIVDGKECNIIEWFNFENGSLTYVLVDDYGEEFEVTYEYPVKPWVKE